MCWQFNEINIILRLDYRNKGYKGGATLLEIKINEENPAAKIVVVGVGGAGNNAEIGRASCRERV